MNMILSWAGLSDVQQRSLCLSVVEDQAQQTEIKLTDALTSLKRLQEVVRATRDVHKEQASSAALTRDLKLAVAPIDASSRELRSELKLIHSLLDNDQELTSESLTDEEVTDDNAPIATRKRTLDAAMNRGTAARDASLSNSAHRSTADDTDLDIEDEGRNRKRRELERDLAQSETPHDTREESSVVDDLKARLALVEPDGELYKCITAAVKVAELESVLGEERCVDHAVESTATAIRCFLPSPFSPWVESDTYLTSESISHAENLRVAVSVVVRAVLETDGTLASYELRELDSQVRDLHKRFPGPPEGRQWCTKLRNFVEEYHGEPSDFAAWEKGEISEVLWEVRRWGFTKYTAERLEEVMTIVKVLLERFFEGWNQHVIHTSPSLLAC